MIDYYKEFKLKRTRFFIWTSNDDNMIFGFNFFKHKNKLDYGIYFDFHLFRKKLTIHIERRI